jgi:hypothetical protein
MGSLYRTINSLAKVIVLFNKAESPLLMIGYIFL